jgi:hypothetical protein
MTLASRADDAHPHVAILRALYTDLPTLGKYAAEDIVLHPADRTQSPAEIRGVDAAVAHERTLVALTDDTLSMDVQHISANDHFGAVLGVLRATRPRTIAMPFCGLWRFADGRIIEHWENAYEADVLREQLSPPAVRPQA